MSLREILALNLRKYRASRRFSQEELADRAKVDRTYVSALERCVYAASIDKIEKLALALGVEPSELLTKPKKTERREPKEK